mmetsp:Transcript_39235/g.80373  ORF Transcript_39235/g.80373 Transcript_39235/m.80373 type:complete len:809 (+) Transcript_39235:729-3155(+)
MLREHVAAKRRVYETQRAQMAYGHGQAGGDLKQQQGQRRRVLAEGQRPTELKQGDLENDRITQDMIEPSEHGGHDTEGLVVADRTGMVVVLTQSLGNMFGSGVCDPERGFCLQGRGYGFAVEAPGDHPNLYRPGCRPAHTLSPYLVTKDGAEGWVMGVGSKGGDRAPYAFTQFLYPFLKMKDIRKLADAIALPRFRDQALGAPTPWAPRGWRSEGVAGSGGAEPLELEGFPQNWKGVSSVEGFRLSAPLNNDFEDSGFGILHVVLVGNTADLTPQSDLPGASAPSLLFLAATDSTRKPGKAAVVEPLDDGKVGRYSSSELAIAFDKKGMLDAIHAYLDTPPPDQQVHNTTDVVLVTGDKYCNLLSKNKDPHIRVNCNGEWWANGMNQGQKDVKVIERAGNRGGDNGSWRWSVRSVVCYEGTPAERHGVVEPIGNYTTAIAGLFPLGKTVLMGPTVFMSAIAEDKVSWISWLSDLGLGAFLPVTLSQGRVRRAVFRWERKHPSNSDRRGVLLKVLESFGLKFPMVLKRSGASWGNGVMIAQEEAHLDKYLPDLLPDTKKTKVEPGKEQAAQTRNLNGGFRHEDVHAPHSNWFASSSEQKSSRSKENPDSTEENHNGAEEKSNSPKGNSSNSKGHTDGSKEGALHWANVGQFSGQARDDETLLVQEALMGNVEVTVNLIAYHGVVLITRVFHFSFSSPLFIKSVGRDQTPLEGLGKREEKKIVQMEDEPEQARMLVEELVRKTRLNGFACIQYKVMDQEGCDCSQKTVKLIEVNPRPCASIRDGSDLGLFTRTWIDYHERTTRASAADHE